MFEALPEEWREVVLSDVAEIVTASISANELATKSKVHHYSLPAFDLGLGPEVGPGNSIKSNKTLVPNDCILFSKLNPRIPRVWRVKSINSPDSYCSTEFWPLVLRSNDVDLDFLAYFLGSAGFLTSPAIVPSSSTNSHQRVDRRSFESFILPLPPLDEQRWIAEVLRSVDDTIRATQAALHAATSVRQCALDALMRGLVELAGDEMPALYEAAEVRTGIAKNKNANGRHVRLPYLRVANVQDGWFDLSDMQEIDVEPEKVERYSLKAGDVLLTEGGDYDKLGRGGVWMGEVHPCLHQNHIFCVRPDPARLLPRFLALVTQSFLGRSYFLSCAKRTTNLASINSSQLKALPLPLPDLDRQGAVVAEIGCVDAVIEYEEEKCRSLLSIRASLQRDLLSGRVRVPPLTVAATSTSRIVQPAFKRAVLAAEIVYQLHRDAKFGSVKHEKIVHLCELHADLHADLDRHAYKEAAGPYDPKARRSVEKVFRAQKWFEVTKGERRVEYVPLEKCGSHRSYYERYFGDHHLHIQSIIDRMRPMTSEQCEIVATLYAVWNDFLIDGETPTDHKIVQSVLNSWHPSKRNISEDRWLAALPWMRSNDFVPKGVGEKTRVVSS